MWKRLFVAVLLMAGTVQAAEMTFAERLGWPEGSRVLMLHADDLGLSHASNQATIATIQAHTVTSVSIMMPCSWVPEFAAYLKENPKLCAGLHLTMTAEWTPYRWGPVAGRDAVPGLVDAAGYMHDNVGGVVANATADEVEAEIRAQIALAEKMGIEITHIDSHMGALFARPDYFERYLKVGIEKQFPILIAGGHLTIAKDDNPEAVEALQKVVPMAWNAGLPVLDDIDTRSYSWKTTKKTRDFVKAIRELEPGVTWFNIHPTLPTKEGIALTENREHLFGDYYALIDPKVRKAIEDEGVILTTWHELMERRQAAGDAPLE